MRRLLLLPILLLLASSQLWGVIGIDATVSSDRSSWTSSITTPSFSTTAPNELLLAFISTDARSAGIRVTAVTGAGVTWSLVQRTNVQLGTAEIWRAFAAFALSGVTVRATLSQGVPASITVVTFAGTDTSGVNGISAIGATASANGSSGAPTASLVTTRNDSWVLGVGNDWDHATARTLGPGQTMVHQYLATVGDTYWVQRQTAPTPLSGTTVTINDTAPTTDRYNLTIVEILAAPTSGVTYTITGTITPVANGAGASVLLTGAASASTTADSSGNYIFTGLANGNYTVRPSKTGFNFSPASQNVIISGASQTANFTATPQTWTLSGAITPTSIGAGSTVILSQSGTTLTSATADANGNYSFASLANGTYTVTPTKTGVTFSPVSQNVIINGANQTANFTAATQTWTISGAITPSSIGAGSTVTLSQSGTTLASATADANGNYSFASLANGTYTVTPTKTAVTFTPISQNVTINGANQTANFTAAAQTWTISGAIAPSSYGAATTVTLTGTTTATTTADSNGNYSFTGLSNGNYTVTPAKDGCTFSPTFQSVTINGASQTVNFTASMQTWTVSGTITPSAAGAGTVVTLALNGTGVTSATADAGGNYTLTGVANGSYTVTPARSGYAFTPSFQAVTVNGTNLAGIDFAAAALPTYIISGTISPSANGAGATVKLTGTSGATTTADASGNYSFSGLATGSYTVTPSKSGFTFIPVSQSVAVSGGDVTGVNFTASTRLSIDAIAFGDRNAASSSVTTNTFSTAASNELLLAFIASDGISNGVTVQTVTGAGLTWTLVRRTNVQLGTAEIWRAFALSPLTSTSVTATLSQSVASSITVVGFIGTDPSGTNGSGAIGATASANASSGAPSASLVTTRNGSWVFGVGNDWDRPIARTLGPNQTLIHQFMPSVGDTYWVQQQNSPTAIAGTTVTINDTAPNTDRYNLTAVEVLPVPEGWVPTYSISGILSPSAQGTGATLILSGAANATTTADASGTYLFSGLLNGSYSVTPAKAGFTFAPTTQNVAINGADVSGVNFTVAPQAGVISGTITPASNGAGSTLTLSGAGSATTTADSSGNYSFSGLADGTYTVTPSKPSVTFNPTSQNVTLSGSGVTGVNFSATATTPNLTVDGSLMYQTIDGMGVNIDVGSWKGGQVIPALDLLIDVNGASLFRVVRDPMTWVTDESQIPLLHALDPTTLQTVYEVPAMQDIWNTIAYLNQKAITGNQVMLNFMGWTPTWLGGSGRYGAASYISAGKEPAFATMLASLVYYGRKIKNLDFTLMSPMNESDLSGGVEGPSVSARQYVTVLDDLIAEMNYMGVGDIRLVGPDTAGSGGDYISAMMADTSIRSSVDHLATHMYGGSTSPGTSYPPRNYWLTETAASCSGCDSGGTPSQGEWAFASQTNDYVLADLNNGWSAVVLWDGYDSFFYHENAYNRWGLVAYDQTTGTYTARKRLYVNAQISRFVRPGATRISVSESISGLNNVAAFYHPITGGVSIVGHNAGSLATTINGQLKNLPVTVTSLAIYWTNGTTSFQRGPDVPVSAGGGFAVTVPADTFFSLGN